MNIKSISFKNFRNYGELDLKFDPLVNIFYGDNAQGKTNILEGIYIGGTTKSHRNSKDKEIIKFNEDESHIRIVIEKKGIDYKIDMLLRKNRSKAIAVNGIPLKKAAELLGILKLVFFSPEDLSIIKNGPSERRKFVDMELSQLDGFYLNDLSNYTKILNQRNRLLKDMVYSRESYSLLDVWDEQLIAYGKRIIKRRHKFIDEINPIIKKIHNKISGNKEECVLIYEPDVNYDKFENAVWDSREKDLKYKTTSHGPHRDDIVFEINGIDVRKYGSQGQQRTCALSLKLSEIEIIKNISGDYPVLLLDDVLSELDSSRQKYLMDSIGDIQTFITCTGLDDFINKRLNLNSIFNVVNGSVNNNIGKTEILKEGFCELGT